MKTTVNLNDFIDGFKQANREDNFSYEGKIALFDYFEELEMDCDIDIEFDIIAFCCEYTEYEDLKEFYGNYDKEDYETLETIRDYTTVIEIDGSDSFIVADF